MAWIGVATNVGNTLFAQYAAGGHTLTLDGATVGSGTMAEANMRIATDLTNNEAEASIVSIDEITNGTKYKLQVGPSDTHEYTAHQIGIWGHIDDGETVLVALCQDSSAGVGVPLRSVSPNFAFGLYAALVVDNSGNLVVNIDESAYVTVGTMNAQIAAVKQRYDDALAKIGLVVYNDQLYIQPYTGA
ncbi:MAG: hypothetical protein IJ124_14540 [Clostridia bacterium]|nr:hypothetical protein [Clostridia bacterium]